MTLRFAFSIQAVRDDLVSRLSDRLGDTVLVREDPPLQVPDISERLYVEGAENIDYERRLQQGIGGRRESYRIPVIVEVRKVGTEDATRREARDRLWEIVGELDAELVEDVDEGLAGVTNVAAIESMDEEKVYAMPDGWLARTRLMVYVEATV